MTVLKRFGWVSACALISLSALSGCAAEDNSPPAVDEPQAVAGITDTRNAFMKAMADADFAALGQIAGEDFLMTPPGSPTHMEMYAAAGNGLAPGYRIEIRPMELVIINEEWAFERGTSIQSWQPEDSEQRVSIPNTYLMILRNTEGQWRPYREVASALPPPEGWPDPAP